MLYLVSDIHGNYKKFKTLLSKIKFDRENDHMIVLGDVIDRGPDPINLLNYIRENVNNGTMSMLLGNHEIFAIMNCKGQLEDKIWAKFGGEQTLIELSRMQKKERIELISFLDNLPYYIEINSPFFGNTILTHTGIDIDNLSYNRDNSINVKRSIEKAVNKNLFYMVGRDLHDMPYSYKKLLDSFLIVGHIPTIELNDSGSNCFYRTKHYMVIDAGVSCVKKGGTLGCYCVDTDEEIYI